MEPTVKPPRFILVENLDGTLGQVNSSACQSTEIECDEYRRRKFIHRTAKLCWYLETFMPDEKFIRASSFPVLGRDGLGIVMPSGAGPFVGVREPG